MKPLMQLARKTHVLSPSFCRRLNCYGLQAGAAGVGLLALVQPSEAKIIYTRAHHVISGGDSYNLDLNHDGMTDLTLQVRRSRFCTTDGTCHYFESLRAQLARNNRVVHNVFGAVAMKSGMGIGHNNEFGGERQSMAAVGTGTSSSAGGSWVNVKNRYLGVKFSIKGVTHYGWARLSVQVQPTPQITATLTGYAYETTPNKPIVAGQTKGTDDHSVGQAEAALKAPTPKLATLGLLAVGSPGLSIWRREESVGVA
jgi:hypothetical protein